MIPPRNQSKRHLESTGEADKKKPRLESGRQNRVDSVNGKDTLADISRAGVDKLITRFNGRGLRDWKKQDSILNQCDVKNKSDSRLKEKEKQAECSNRNDIKSSSSEGGTAQQATHDDDQSDDELEWEDGAVNTTFIPASDDNEGKISSVTVEFEASPDTPKWKAICRASAKDKELAELVHKVHLLCLLGRGRLIDQACNDTLIQAALLSLVPRQFLRISEIPKLTAKALAPLVDWFHRNFRVRTPSDTGRSVESALALTLEAQEGTAEEVTALCVALFRALKLTTRFVSILDVASLKPCVATSESTTRTAKRKQGALFNSSTLMATPPKVSNSPFIHKDTESQTSGRHMGNNIRETASTIFQAMYSSAANQSNYHERRKNMSDACAKTKDKGLKRKSDIVFEMQLERALAATAAENDRSKRDPSHTKLPFNSQNMSFKGMKRVKFEECSSSQGASVAIGSSKIGAPLYFAEVYCSGASQTGKWVHVDAVNAIVDGEQRVEAAVAACKTSLRYAVAFAGHGAKDVTRRYCTKWYKIASGRINSRWWDAVLAPLKELELSATEQLECVSSPAQSMTASRSCLEDMELETRALTEPLPTNQQAYKNHSLYALERWLTKYQILHPRGPILGFCSSHPVYPRTCVQVLHTKERWLREGLQIKVNELPAKVLKRSLKQNKEQAPEADDYDEGDDSGRDTVLYGEWQTEPLKLPRAVNGIVPRNERGQVDVWSEKCLPPGTVHLRLPMLVPIAQRLKIDFAPAMVGFEFRSGRSFPVYEGIVVCAEFKDAILEVYTKEEERRREQERRRTELQAVARWYQLLSSIVIRRRLNNRYGAGSASQSVIHEPNSNVKSNVKGKNAKQTTKTMLRNSHDTRVNARQLETDEYHEHVFVVDDRNDNDESSMRIKRCYCGFFIEFEVL